MTRLRPIAPAFLALSLRAGVALAADPVVPPVTPAAERAAFVGLPVLGQRWFCEGAEWCPSVAPPPLIPAGQPFHWDAIREAQAKLLDQERFRDLAVWGEGAAGGVWLEVHALPQRRVAAVDWRGDDVQQRRRGFLLSVGSLIVEADLARAGRELQDALRLDGFSQARVRVTASTPPGGSQVEVVVETRLGPRLRVATVRVETSRDALAERVVQILRSYPVKVGDEADPAAARQGAQQLQERLRKERWLEATVASSWSGATLVLRVEPGPRYVFRFEGNRSFDPVELQSAALGDGVPSANPQELVQRLQRLYERVGLIDAAIAARLSNEAGGEVRTVLIQVREGSVVRVARREFPCLDGPRDAAAVGTELDGAIGEQLASASLLGPVAPAQVDDLWGPREGSGARSQITDASPWSIWVPEAYGRGAQGLQELFRSEGYLSAQVQTPRVLRRACSPQSPADGCLPVGPPPTSRAACTLRVDGGWQTEPEPPPEWACVPDATGRRRCEPNVVVSIPVRVGPRAFLHDIRMEGNVELVEQDLVEAAALPLGAPATPLALEEARERVLGLYLDEGYAFARVDTRLDLSEDGTRARYRFVIVEGERVRIARIVLRGLSRTHEETVRARLFLEEGGYYERDLVRDSEQALATLGVFASVAIALDAPYLPSRQKDVIVTVQERLPMTFGGGFGYGTADGFRGGIDFGHNNLLGRAIAFRSSIQMNFLPTSLIIEDDVREKYEEEIARGNLTTMDRLERRITAGLEWPHFGLGPNYRLNLEGVHLRDNARDFGITKHYLNSWVAYQSRAPYAAELGAGVELNDATVFGDDGVDTLTEFRVPEGQTIAYPQRIDLRYDLRDQPLGATRGALFSLGFEHVYSRPLPNQQGGGDGTTGSTGFVPTKSSFLRPRGRIATYVPFGRVRPTVLALSFRAGVNVPLYFEEVAQGQVPSAYPDRLYYMGGSDSLRGYAQDSLVPEDLAEELMTNPEFTLNQVGVRGGNVFVNPAAELRWQVNDTIGWALFLDAGNSWFDRTKIQPWKLRYTAGLGFRLHTPVGPLAFDYGWNLQQLAYYGDPGLQHGERYWEDLGAFHFSVGSL